MHMATSAASDVWQVNRPATLFPPNGHLPGEASDFYAEIKDASPDERVVFLVGPPTFLSLAWPTEVMAAEKEPQQCTQTTSRQRISGAMKRKAPAEWRLSPAPARYLLQPQFRSTGSAIDCGAAK